MTEGPSDESNLPDWLVAVPRQELRDLVNKSTSLVKMLDDAEVNHGGLWSGKTMRARDDLRLELSRWK